MRSEETVGYDGPYDVMWSVKNPSPPPGHLPFSVHYNSTRVYQKSLEVASDLPSKRNTRSTWNAFQHYVRKTVLSSALFPFATSQYVSAYYPGGQYDLGQVGDCNVGWGGNSCGYGPVDMPFGSIPELYIANITDDFVNSGVDEVGLSSDAFMAILPGIRPNLSILNSIYELKDFKTLPRTLRRISLIPKSGKKTLRRILGGGADSYLQAEFNILPLLSDICGIQKSIKQTRKRVNKLLADEGERKVSRIAWPLENSHLFSKDQSSGLLGWESQFGNTPDYLIGYVKAHRAVSYALSVFKAQMEYSFTLPGWQRENAAMLGFADALGVNLNPAIIWNAIPWSFVVDWVLGISKYLDHFKARNLNPVTHIYRWCWSVRVERLIRCFKDIGIDGPAPAYSIPVSTINEVAYKRATSSPDIYAAITSSGLSVKEFSLGVALGGSRLR